MLRQEELEFIKVMSNIKLPRNFLRELGKAVVGMKKAIAVSVAYATIASALEHQSGVESEALSFCDSSKLPVTKKGAEELSSSN